MRLSEEEFRALQNRTLLKDKVDNFKKNFLSSSSSVPSYNKYKNQKVELDGYKFDSKKEMEHYSKLKLMERGGLINNLQLQVKFELIPKLNDERAVNYIADFVYFDNIKQKNCVVDVKGFKTKEYILKRKLFKWRYNDHEFNEV